MNPNNFYAIIPESLACKAESDTDQLYSNIAQRLGIINITGVLGPCDYNEIHSLCQKLFADPSIDQVVLNINSPGGSVLGISPLIDCLRNKGSKQLVAIANHVCASAAYWIASACDKVFLASQTAVVGSIGVIATHMDLQEEMKKWGVKVTEIVAGTQKNLASPYRKIDEAAQKYYQNRVEEIYAIFVADVSAGRNLSEDTIRKMEGTDLLGKSAIEAGLADGFVNFLEYITMGKISSLIAAKAETPETPEKEKEAAEEEMEEKDEKDEEEKEPEEDEEAEDEDPKEGEKEEDKPAQGKALQSERSRILAILDLAGVKLSAGTVKAISVGQSAERFAMTAMTEFRKSGNMSALGMLAGEAPRAQQTMRDFTKDEEQAILKDAAVEVNKRR